MIVISNVSTCERMLMNADYAINHAKENNTLAALIALFLKRIARLYNYRIHTIAGHQFLVGFSLSQSSE